MNRRPSKTSRSYDDLAPLHAARFKAASPDMRFFESRKTRSPLRAFCLYGAILLFLLLAVNFAANQFVFLRRVQVPITRLSESFDGYTILHLSDLKGASFGKNQNRLLMALGNKPYDAVLLTGDMVSPMGNAEPLYALITALKTQAPGVPIYFIAGDNDPTPVSKDYSAGGSPLAPWVLGAQQRGAVLLNAPQRITREDQTLWLSTVAQLNLDLLTTQQQYTQAYMHAKSTGDADETELAEYNLGWLQSTADARASMHPEDVFVTLTHVPPTQNELLDMAAGLTREIDLMLCGHYLGGLLRLPLLGPLFIPSQTLARYGLLPGNSAHNGLQRVGRTWVYTSPGLGHDDPLYPSAFFRLFNPPSATLLTLTPSSL